MLIFGEISVSLHSEQDTSFIAFLSLLCVCVCIPFAANLYVSYCAYALSCGLLSFAHVFIQRHHFTLQHSIQLCTMDTPFVLMQQ